MQYERLKKDYRKLKKKKNKKNKKQKLVIKELKMQLEEYIERDREDSLSYRIVLGALLSTIDTLTDIYVGEKSSEPPGERLLSKPTLTLLCFQMVSRFSHTVATYYSIDGLKLHAHALLVMISVNTVVQLIIVMAQYRKKRWTVKLKEALITLFFLRPIVDAYRISTNYKDPQLTFEILPEMMCNKVSETLEKIK